MQQLPTLLRQQCWELLHACWQWCANGCNNSQHCCANNVGSCCMRVGSGVQTDATTPNIVAPTMLGVAACVLAVVCKRMQQLPTLLRQQCWELLRACWQWCANGCNNSQQCWHLQCVVGRIQPISLYKRCVMSVRGPNNVGTLWRSRNKRNVGSCWLKSLTGFKL